MKAIIVDDEAVAAAALKRRINWEKYGIDEVLKAGSMRQAIDIMSDVSVDLMLCDVEMPGGSGLELYEWARTYRKETECIFVSCHPEYEYVRKALTMGSMDYVLKPVDYDEMDKILTSASERIKSRNENKDINAKEDHPGIDHKISVSESLEITKSTTKCQSSAISKAIDIIMQNLDKNMSINELAEAVFLNPQYFMRLFKKETGKSVLEFITECRLAKVKTLLKNSGMSITEAALSAGYDNFSYFSKLFKKYEGITPSDYRKH